MNNLAELDKHQLHRLIKRYGVSEVLQETSIFCSDTATALENKSILSGSDTITAWETTATRIAALSITPPIKRIS